MCTFAQVFRFFLESRVPDRALRCRLTEKDFLFEVAFVGLGGAAEEGMDWGGLYREVRACGGGGVCGRAQGRPTVGPVALRVRIYGDGGASSSSMRRVGQQAESVDGGARKSESDSGNLVGVSLSSFS